MTNDVPPTAITMWLADPLPADVSKSLQRLAQSADVRQVVVLPDVHLAGEVCNGTAIATRELIYPVAVGGDIGCGMLAVAVNLSADSLAKAATASGVLSGLQHAIPLNKHARANVSAQLPADLQDRELSTSTLEKLKTRDGLFQLGTLGSGNHFVEFQSDNEGQLWLMLHSGSRGMGQAITAQHLKSTILTNSGLGALEAAAQTGQDYLSDLNWAIDYAKENRLAMARRVDALLASLFDTSIDWQTLIHCQHNHVRRETHSGQSYWVHRKGALPAAEGEPGVIPGSMGSRSYHVTGRGLAQALRSSSHGAGRLFARQQARRLTSRRELQRQMRGVWFDEHQAEGLRDEAPSVYKEIGRVMRAQRDLTRIERELHPVLVYKGVSRPQRQN